MTNKASFFKIIGMMCAIFAVLTLTSVFIFGQAETGTIAGVVKDTTGAVVTDAKVVVKNIGTNAERTASTGSLGQYTVPALQPGKYEVVISKSGFKTYKATTEVTVGGHLAIDAELAVGSSNTVVEVVAGGIATVNTETQEMSQLIDTQQMAQLPSLTRNPYDFVAISGNISSGDSTSNGGAMSGGQETTNRGVGFNINGQRSSGTEILLDGVENISVFSVGIGQNHVPLDEVQEYSVVTNNFTAEYGRASGGVVNVTTKAGTNSWHGSAYEFNRLSGYTANTYDNTAKDLPRGIYTRNQFGYVVGGPIMKNKLFISDSMEWIRVRSVSNQQQEIFDPTFISYLPSNAQAYFAAFGANHAPSAGVAATVDQVNATCGLSGGICIGPVNGTTTIPGNTPVWDTVPFKVPFDAGGGLPQNTYGNTGRIDYNLSEKTQMFFRGANEKEIDFPGTSTPFTAYTQYNVGSTEYDQSYLFSVSHNFNPTLLNNTKVSFARYNVFNSYNKTFQSVPDLMFVTPADPVTQGDIAMPGLFNNSSPGTGGLPYGGPQDTIQVEHDLSWTKGRHNMKFGGQFTYIQLNQSYGAYAQAVEQLGNSGAGSMTDLLNTAGNPGGSQLVTFESRVNPQGAFPCPKNPWGEFVGTTIAPGQPGYGTPGTNACPADSVVQPPLPPAVYARSYRYKDWAIYGQDSFRATPRLTLNYGLRFEHFGVQHNNHQDLDSNFYFGSGSGILEQVRNGAVSLTQKSSIGQFWQPSWGTLGPRVGFAWDIFGDGKTSLRGGFGISYERNFGNVTFNASFNPPASAVVSDKCSTGNKACTYLVTNNDEGPFGVAGPAANLAPGSLRMPQPNIHTAQTQFWSLAIQREVARNTVFEISYSGAHGVHLYDINNVDQYGWGNIYLGDPLYTTQTDPATGYGCNTFVNLDTFGPECPTLPNSQYSAINMRGSGGSSAYHGLNLNFRTQNLRNTGLSLVANYTWSKSLDDESSAFSDSLQGGSSAVGGFGSLGYTDFFNPKLDWGPSDYDVRQRVVISPIWETPWFKSQKGIGEALGGWTFVGVFTARTGVPFSVYDLDFVEIGYTEPRVALSAPTSFHVSSNPPPDPTAGPNHFLGLTVPVPSNSTSGNSLLGYSDLGPFPANMTGRNAFRGPGAWNFDLKASKKFRITERLGMEFDAEGYNIFNHHNLYAFVPFAGFCGYACSPTGAAPTPLSIDELKGGLNVFATGGNHDERRFGQFALRFNF